MTEIKSIQLITKKNNDISLKREYENVSCFYLLSFSQEYECALYHVTSVFYIRKASFTK